VRWGDGEAAETGRARAHRWSVKGPASPEMKGEGEARIICRGRVRWGGAHRRDGVAAAPRQKISGGRSASAAWVDEWCCGVTREGRRHSSGADSQRRRKCVVGHFMAVRSKWRGQKEGSVGPGALPLGEGKVRVWHSVRHVAGEGGRGVQPLTVHRDSRSGWWSMDTGESCGERGWSRTVGCSGAARKEQYGFSFIQNYSKGFELIR
jgi:hypothetical protein